MKKNAVWRADPERVKKWAETEKDGPLVNRVYNQLIYMLAWESLNERVAKFDAFGKDPDRARVLGESEKNGPIVQQVTTTILRPTAFSPMK